MKDISPKIFSVEPQSNYTLRVTFDNGEIRLFDIKPFLEDGVFQALKNVNYFNRVKPVIYGHGIEWPDEQDLSTDTLYLSSTPLSQETILPEKPIDLLGIHSKEDVKTMLDKYSDEVKLWKIKELTIFGSFARNEEADDESDIDLLVKFSEPIGYFEYYAARRFLGRLFERPVDLLTEDAIRPEYRDQVDKEKIRALP